MAFDRLPPAVDENDLKGSLERMYEYMFYLREQTQYEIDLIKKRMGDKVNGGI